MEIYSKYIDSKKIIEHIEKKITNLKGYKIQLMGSYRRKKPFSKDIDVLLCHRGKEDSFEKYLTYLRKQFDIHVYLRGDDKMS